MAIEQLIKNGKIGSQDSLLEHLRREGFALTQATLSRDLKFLKVGKISDGGGDYIYTLPGGDKEEAARAWAQDFLKGYKSIDWSGSILLVKTWSGHSDPVCLALDNFDFPEVLGTIAGRDNAVAGFLREGVTGEDFIRRLKEVIPGF